MALFEPKTELREVKIHNAQEACMVYIDVQNASMHPDGIFYEADEYFLSVRDQYVGNLQKLQAVTRRKGLENVFVVIESLTKDGRDRSLDYKISGFNIPPNCFDGKVIDEIQPMEDEIVIKKTSCDVFVSTNIAYVLRNLGVKQIILVGMLTDQCVSSSVRTACDLGFLVTLVPDGCFTRTAARHDAALSSLAGFCRQRKTNELLEELEHLVDKE